MPSPWTSVLSTQVSPVNQLEALPLLSVQQFISPDGSDTLIYGTRVLRYWSPIALGITASQPALTGLKYHITTPWLDVTPCMFFAFVILRDTTGATHAAAKSFSVCLQYKQTPAEAPPVTNNIAGVISDQFNGIWPLTSAATVISFPDQANTVQRATLLTSPNTGVQSLCQNVMLIIGPSVRFQLNWGTVAPDANDLSHYSMSLWGSTS
jgi:hypothetical protein